MKSKINDHSNQLYELRSVGFCGDLSKVLEFIQNEFIVSHQTAKKMIKAGTLLVYHLSKKEAEDHINNYQSSGLLSKMVLMEPDNDDK